MEEKWSRREKMRKKLKNIGECMIQANLLDHMKDTPLSHREKKTRISAVEVYQQTQVLQQKNRSLANVPENKVKPERKYETLTPYLRKRKNKKVQKQSILNFQT